MTPTSVYTMTIMGPSPANISRAPPSENLAKKSIIDVYWDSDVGQPLWINHTSHRKKRLTLYRWGDQGEHDTSNQKPISRGVTCLCTCAQTCKTNRFSGILGRTSGRRSGSFWPSHTLKTVLVRSRQPSFFTLTTTMGFELTSQRKLAIANGLGPLYTD